MSVHFDLILNKLTRFIKRYYVNELIKGALLFLAIGLAYFLLVLLLETIFWLSVSGRTFLFWTFIVVEGLLFIKYIGISLVKLFNLGNRLSPLEASKIIGTHFQGVNDQLVNLLQLKESPIQSELLQASIAQKSAQLSPLPFSSAINFKKSFTYIKYALIPLFCFIIISIFNGKNWYSKSFNRVVNYSTAYTPPAPFYFKIINSNLSVLQQQDFTLKVVTYGTVVPNQISVQYDNETYFLKKNAHNQFTYNFKGLTTDVPFKLLSGNEVSKSYLLKVNSIPSISDFKTKIIPPIYTRESVKEYKNTGNVTIPEGSKIEWELKTVNASSVNFNNNSKTSRFLKSRNNFKYSKQVHSNMDYEITTSNKFISEYEKLVFSIEVIKDKHPSIKVFSKPDTTTINQQLFYGQLADDYGLNKLELVYFKQDEPTKIIRKKIAIQSNIVTDFTFRFPSDLDLDDATSYAFYFEVFDNDAVNGSKTSKSEIFNYRNLSSIEKEQQIFKNDSQNLDAFSKSFEELQSSGDDLKSFTKLQKQKSSLSFKEKQKLSDVLDKHSKEQKKLQSLQKKLTKSLDKLEKDKNGELIKEQLERSRNELKKNEKLIDELKKMMEKFDPQELKKNVDELEKQNKKQNKNLSQILELTKRYYVIDKHQKIAQMLETLSKKQEKLADSIPNNAVEKQNKINKEWKIIKDELNELREFNGKLKKPMRLDDDPSYEEKIENELNDAIKKLTKEKKEEAKIKQKTAATMLQNLADKMQKSSSESGGGDADENEEDAKMLRQILDNLVLYSMNQEENMNSFKISKTNNPSYSSYVRRQQVLREHFDHIDDSLFALASRNPKIGTGINDLIADIDSEMTSSLEYLTENLTLKGVIKLQYAVTHSNDLSLILSKKLGLLNQQSKPGKGKKGKKNEGFQLPDIIKKQESLNAAMQNLLDSVEKKAGDSKSEGEGGEKKPGLKGKKGNEGKESKDGKEGKEGKMGKDGSEGKSGEEGKKGKNGKSGENGNEGEGGNSGKNGKKGEGNGGFGNENKGENSRNSGKKGKGGEKGENGLGGKGKGKKGGKNNEGESLDEESDYEQLFEIYKEQQELRNQLENKLNSEGISPSGKRILSQMRQVEDELIEKGFNRDALKKMIELKHQLFKLDKAQFEQGKDSKRKSSVAKKQINNSTVITPNQIKQYFNTTEILNRQVLPLQPEFKKKVQDYFLVNPEQKD